MNGRILLSAGRAVQGAPLDHPLLFQPPLGFAQIQKPIAHLLGNE
ncbi:hypothetical protein [Candidatus Methylacidiphilum fumarolicum]|nr:hypothetical protein [Candidatus Methylacidiphilum fumarolicum]